MGTIVRIAVVLLGLAGWVKADGRQLVWLDSERCVLVVDRRVMQVELTSGNSSRVCEGDMAAYDPKSRCLLVATDLEHERPPVERRTTRLSLFNLENRKATELWSYQLPVTVQSLMTASFPGRPFLFCWEMRVPGSDAKALEPFARIRGAYLVWANGAGNMDEAIFSSLPIPAACETSDLVADMENSGQFAFVPLGPTETSRQILKAATGTDVGSDATPNVLVLVKNDKVRLVRMNEPLVDSPFGCKLFTLVRFQGNRLLAMQLASPEKMGYSLLNTDDLTWQPVSHLQGWVYAVDPQFNRAVCSGDFTGTDAGNPTQQRAAIEVALVAPGKKAKVLLTVPDGHGDEVAACFSGAEALVTDGRRLWRVKGNDDVTVVDLHLEANRQPAKAR